MLKSVKSFVYLFGIAIVLTVGYSLSKNKTSTQDFPVKNICTQDVRECEDGSFVKRSGPNCEFDLCPLVVASSTEVVGTTTKSFFDVNQKIYFEYPDNFYLNSNFTEYVVPVEWPPQVSVVNTEYISCKSSNLIPSGTPKWKTINGKTFCVITESEGAAGSTYTTYAYKSLVNKKNVTMLFVTREPQCSNFEEPRKTACEKEKKAFQVDELVGGVFSTIRFEKITE
jgi:hypothetical protein